jgi:two-component system, NarL family, nitrate/nitrite response regulator NarL
MNSTEPLEMKAHSRLPVAVCEAHPLMVEGLRAILAASGIFALSDSAKSLEEAARIAITSSPRIMIVDKNLGVPSVMEWLTRLSAVCPATAIIVWGSAMTEAEALRYLKAGARAIIRKTSDVATVLACLEAVVDGSTWMEEGLFRGGTTAERKARLELTPREQQVLELVEQGLRNKDIAGELGICPGTVKIHLKHIFEKTGVHGRYGLALSGLRQKASPQMLTAF